MKNFYSKIREMSDMKEEDEDCGGVCENSEVLKRFMIREDEMPPDSSLLGRSSWILLHTMAANYPDEPNEETQELTKTFLNVFSKLYPCKYCATDFQLNIEKVKSQIFFLKCFFYLMFVFFFFRKGSSQTEQ